MLIRSSLLALATFAAIISGQTAPTGGTHVFIPTSTAIRIAEAVARGEGYDLSDRRRYFFDLVQGAAGKPLIDNYIALGFYWNGDLINTIAINERTGLTINERTGLTIDATGCAIFDYPALRAYRTSTKLTLIPPADLKQHTGCDSFQTIRVPKPIPRTMRQ